MNKAQWAMIRKDIGDMTGSVQTFVPLLVVPLLMMLVFPILFVVGAHFGSASLSSLNGLDEMLVHFGDRLAGDTPAQTILNVGLNVFFPSLFLLIPIMCASIMGAMSFVGEKEHRTLESILYTPMSFRQMFAAKVTGTVLLSLGITVVSLLLFGTVVNIGGILEFGRLIFPNWKWLILLFWVTPAITFLGVLFMVYVSAKAQTFQDAQQMSIFVVLPVLLLIIGQASGLFLLNEGLLLGIGLVIFVVDWFLLRLATKHFTPEKAI